jgi:hypothetical protein
MAIAGELRRLSLTVSGSSTKAAFGAESAAGDGVPPLDVVQSGAVPLAFAAVQPAGSAGAVTPSKLALNELMSGPSTWTAAEALFEPPFVLVNEAVFESVAPHVPAVVPVTTWTCVLAPTASDVWLQTNCWFGGEPVTDQPALEPPASTDQLTPLPEGRASLTAIPVAVWLPAFARVTVNPAWVPASTT